MASKFLGRISNSHNKLKSILSLSLCTSYRYNSRNLERPWYILWASTLHDLADPFDDILVCPQYPLWHVPEDDEEPSQEHLSDSNDESYRESNSWADLRSKGLASGRKVQTKNKAARSQAQANDSDDEFAVIGVGEDIVIPPSPPAHDLEDYDTTMDSIFTEAGRGALERVPDFVLLHVSARRIPKIHLRFEQLSGLQITHRCCAVIVENKKAPKRALMRTRAFNDNLESLIYSAQEDLVFQAMYAFKEDLTLESTILLATAGKHWTYAEAKRDIFTGNLKAAEIAIEWRDVVKLGTADSDNLLEALSEYLGKLSKIDLTTGGPIYTREEVPYIPTVRSGGI